MLMSTVDGLSKEYAIVITASDHQEGIAQEFSYLSDKFGERNKDWNLLQQALVQDGDTNKIFDVLNIELQTGEKKEIFFDITNFFGKGF